MARLAAGERTRAALPAAAVDHNLDDYFFIDREILAWRFLASACKQDKGVLQCPLRQRAQFGTINPHQHSSAPLAMESLGREMLSLKNGPRDLIKLELKTDAGRGSSGSTIRINGE